LAEGALVGRARVLLQADTRGFHRDMDSAESVAKRAGHGIKVGLAVGLSAAAVGFTALTVEIDKSVKAAIGGEVSQTALDTALKNTHQSLQANTAALEAAEAAARKKGFADDDSRSALAKLETATGSTRKSVVDLSLAEDIARFKHVDLDAATKMLTGTMAGNTRAAKALGIVLVPVTTNVDALKERYKQLGKAIPPAELAQAKILDKMATGQSVIDAVTKRVHGQGDAYSRTAAGGMARFHAQLVHIQEGVGGIALPALTKMADFLTAHVLPAVQNVSEFLGKVFGQKSFDAKVHVAAEGLRDLGGKVRESVEGAVAGINWPQVGGRIGAGVSSGLRIGGELWRSLLDSVHRNSSEIRATATAMLGVIVDTVNRSTGLLGQIGATLAASTVATLLDPGFWLRHWELALGIAVAVFPIGRAAKIGLRLLEVAVGPFERLFGPALARAGGAGLDLLLRAIEHLPERLTRIITVGLVAVERDWRAWLGRLVGWVSSEVGKLTEMVPRLLRLAFRATAIIDFVNVMTRVFRQGVGAVLGLIDKFLGGMQAMAEGASHLPFVGSKFRGVADEIGHAREKLRGLRDELNQVHGKDVHVRLVVEGGSFTETITGGGKKTVVRGQLYAGPHAAGGRVTEGAGRADDVLALLARDEFVVTGGGERILEALTGMPGVLDWLERVQPRHFVMGGRASVAGVADQIGSTLGRYASAATRAEAIRFGASVLPPPGPLGPTGGGGGAFSSTGLVPQVVRAIGWGHSHGWGGSVTSGFRSYAEQASIWERSGHGTLFPAAPPGRSEHEFGRAIDVTDTYGFGRAMSSAPAGSHLYQSAWIRAHDPIHWSVSGNRAGGRIRGFATGGRPQPPPGYVLVKSKPKAPKGYTYQKQKAAARYATAGDAPPGRPAGFTDPAPHPKESVSAYQARCRRGRSAYLAHWRRVITDRADRLKLATDQRIQVRDRTAQRQRRALEIAANGLENDAKKATTPAAQQALLTRAASKRRQGLRVEAKARAVDARDLRKEAAQLDGLARLATSHGLPDLAAQLRRDAVDKRNDAQDAQLDVADLNQQAGAVEDPTVEGDTGDPTQLPGDIREQIAKSHLTPDTADDLAADQAAKAWYEQQLASGTLTQEQRITVEEAIAGLNQEIASLSAPDADTGGGSFQDPSTIGTAEWGPGGDPGQNMPRIDWAAMRAAFLADRSRFFSQFSSDVYSSTAGGLRPGSGGLGSDTLRAPSVQEQQQPQKTIHVHPGASLVSQHYTQPPEDQFAALRRAHFVAEAALT
jgi:hypothetical protein